MQHLTVLTSKRNSLFDSKGRFHWTMNEPAWNSIICLDSESWTPEQWWHLPNSGKPYQPDTIVRLDLTKLSDKSLFLTLETTACAGTETEVNYLEHVQAVISL